MFQFSEEFSYVDCLQKYKVEYLEMCKILSHLSSCYRDKNYSHKEIPDKEEEGENHLAGPVDLTNFNLNLHLLARIQDSSIG